MLIGYWNGGSLISVKRNIKKNSLFLYPFMNRELNMRKNISFFLFNTMG